MIRTNYNKIAPSYNSRYTANYLVNIENQIKKIISSNNYKNILEAGCGTGRWISSLVNDRINVLGLDYSFDMLKIPKAKSPNINLINADAINIPFKDKIFDLIFCVNAIHHFPDKEKFVIECNRTLTSNGTLTIFGVDPHIDKNWYVYDYFDAVYENDLKRFPSSKSLTALLASNGFHDIGMNIAEEINHTRVGYDVLSDPFLVKLNCSQLANLSGQDYQTGINKIKKQIARDPRTEFVTSVIFYLISAKKK